MKMGKIVLIGVPIQSGSNKILSKMRRKGKIEEILTTLNYLKSRYPTLKISTHLIVGFPGESEDDFSSTLSIFDYNLFHSVMLFKYSDSEVTDASTLDGHIPKDIINERIQRAKDEIGSRVHTLTVFD
jgi:tRNA-2-methylthio-N6-dimethylallyladenosine synthase